MYVYLKSPESIIYDFGCVLDCVVYVCELRELIFITLEGVYSNENEMKILLKTHTRSLKIYG